MSDSPPQIQQLRERFRLVARRHVQGQLWNGLLLTLSVASGAWLVAASIEALLWMSPVARLLLLLSVVIAVVGVLGWYAGRPALRLLGLWKEPTAEDGARLIHPAYPNASSQALTLFDLAEGRRSEAPPVLVRRAAEQLSATVAPVSFEEAISYQPVWQRAKFACLPVMALLAALLFFPSPIGDASDRLLTPAAIYSPPAPFQLAISPASQELLRGDSAEFTITVEGNKLPDHITFITEDNETNERSEQNVTRQDDGTFHVTLDQVQRSFQYRAQSGAVTTEWHEATVKQRPVISELNVRTTPPPYTGEAPRELPPNTGDVHALPETTVQLDVQLAGSPAETAYVVFDDDDTLQLAIYPRQASGSFSLQSDGHYSIHLEDADGTPNREPIKHSLSLREDRAPRITLLAPGPTAELPEAQTSLLRARMHDDYGFSRLRLYYRPSHAEDEAFRSIELPLNDPHEASQVIDYPWRLQADTDLSLSPGQSVDYYLQVWDNDRPSDYKSARTETHRLYVPSAADRAAAVDESQHQLADRFDAVRGNEEEFRSATENLRSDTQRRGRSDGYERQLGEVSNQHRELARQTEELSRDIESTMREMQRERQPGNESQELLEHLEQLSQDMGMEELQKALQSMREALEQEEPGNVEDAMERLAQNEQSFRDRMEQMEELLKQLHTRQQLDALADQAGELAERQEELAEATQQLAENPDSAHAADQEQLAAEQAQSMEDLTSLEQRMQEAAQEMQEVRGAPQDSMNDMMDETTMEELRSQMQKNMEQLRSGELDSAQEGQRQLSESFQQMQEQFGAMQQDMSQQQAQLNTTAVRLALRNTLALSEKQQELQRASGDLSPGSERQRGIAASQQQLVEGLQVVSDTLSTLMRSVPTMTGAVQHESDQAMDAMRAAVEQLTGRTPNQATQTQREAKGHLNRLALMLSRLLEQMQNSDGGGSSSMEQMAQSLEQLAGDQQEMNEQIQQMLNEMQGERLSADQEERMQQLEEQHQRLREQLSEARQEESTTNQDDLDALEEAADDLEEAISDLRQDRLSPEQQQEILMRLLETRRSMRQQDQTPERRAEVARGTYEREEMPPALPPLEPAERLHRDVLRALNNRYVRGYEQLIQRYFEELQQSSNN